MYNFSIAILAFGLTLSNSSILAQTTSSDIRRINRGFHKNSLLCLRLKKFLQ
jgi:hypothetical protein